MNQKQRLRAAVDDLYRDPASARDLARVFEVLEEVRTGVDDGTITPSLWRRRSELAFAFGRVQEERQTLDETEDT